MIINKTKNNLSIFETFLFNIMNKVYIYINLIKITIMSTKPQKTELNESELEQVAGGTAANANANSNQGQNNGQGVNNANAKANQGTTVNLDPNGDGTTDANGNPI